MKYSRNLSVRIVALLASMSASASANAQVTPYLISNPLDRLFLTDDNAMPFNEALSFNSQTEVANFFGTSSEEAALASKYFAGYTGTSAHMIFSRFPYGGGRARLYGGNIDKLRLPKLQAINGLLTVNSDGFKFSANIDLAGVSGFGAAAVKIQKALNAHVPVAAVTTGSRSLPRQCRSQGPSIRLS